MRVLGFTSIRADYDLLSGLYKKMDSDENMKFKVLVSGAHLSEEYGKSLSQIREDGVSILTEVESLISSNSKRSRLKTASIFLQNSIDIVRSYEPDLLIYAGDREDILAASMIGAYLQIPTVHLYGGDHVVDGHVDNPARHATSKLSSVHMVTLPEHKRRLMAMGESEERIHVVGALSLDRIRKHSPMSRKEVLQHFGLSDQPYAIVIFHPQDRELGESSKYLERIINSFHERGIFCFVGYPNTDPDNKNIIKLLERKESRGLVYVYKSLERNIFLSLYKNACVQVGNSSSGIIEAASIPLPVVNVGMRQKGRRAGKNVIFTGKSQDEIDQAIDRALSDSFRESIQEIENIYGDGKSIGRVHSIIKNINFDKFLYKTEDPIEVANNQ
ncbi:UDP-N-acetylglucosamine 2-epimerase [Salinibacter pepae]|uniref:UDP-N-acetylglucosamine 2-epimerase n=1 Tax=Salinibacter pepae TaxID=3040382 RepID=UPI0021E8820F|nr:UDP-N-acetylglucosamine 2-epimerase [Salinibacter pepae]